MLRCILLQADFGLDELRQDIPAFLHHMLHLQVAGSCQVVHDVSYSKLQSASITREEEIGYNLGTVHEGNLELGGRVEEELVPQEGGASSKDDFVASEFEAVCHNGDVTEALLRTELVHVA